VLGGSLIVLSNLRFQGFFESFEKKVFNSTLLCDAMESFGKSSNELKMMMSCHTVVSKK
jgi:hypothetical protein